MSLEKKSMDLYLMEVYRHFIAIKDEDFKKSLLVFNSVFNQVKKKMAQKCKYFAKYSSEVLRAGSVYDGIKVSKLDEFDMDIVIRLPIDYTQVIVENDQPGFVKLNMRDQLANLVRQDDWENCHKVTHDWRDSEEYLLQNKFRYWLHGIVQKAVNDLDGKVEVNGSNYILKYTESGPAFTLNVRNLKGNEDFVLDVDLVPVIRFRLPRWPEGYRPCKVNDQKVKNWLVVPKPNKAMADEIIRNRCWRLSFQEFEKAMIKECYHLKTTIRLVKKLRDRLRMKQIASYYIKTLFLWQVQQNNNKKFWQDKISVLFRYMVGKLYDAIKVKIIPYFWNDHHNLIEGLNVELQKKYTKDLEDVLAYLKLNDVERVVKLLLTAEEFEQFTQIHSSSGEAAPPRAQNSATDELLKTLHDKVDALKSVHDDAIKDIQTALKKIIEKLQTLENNKKEIVEEHYEEEFEEISDEAQDIINLADEYIDYCPKRVKLSDGSKASPSTYDESQDPYMNEDFYRSRRRRRDD